MKLFFLIKLENKPGHKIIVIQNINNVYKLPNTIGIKNGVLIQKGHLTNYGAEVEQGIILSGAKIFSCGQKNFCTNSMLEKALIKNKAKLASKSFKTDEKCLKSLEFCKIARNRDLNIQILAF